ncbi:hypothetical protein PHLGIDRAFT_20039 [Phlebiopsis gigantea 11061_1 CR5-6]|uniref:Uncharacterized protein n=1 Tax=Phlebiopsis gigantea (strain 11061_1 CR5-6) TaxID=745531 RepID=A0A0C3S355_PHLG1|nr:hypothetical protein PHLGIDRAFT_20039 [Phlebiopsis gigantea 11061_1 CR5-6]
MSTFGRDEHVSELGEQLLARTAFLPRSASVRSARSDPGMRARPHATKHARATSDQPCASDETLTEIEERWEGETSRSTAFYSARSSILSGVSTVFGDL